ncbi:OmpA family protein [Paracoccus yeei]|uniref:Flagellar motor protein MotB n=1 Tax=Paracoccus yeei TaxID=147645 RepID=A0A2D2BZM5_9RHOB|nr:OmpA family protein [Paracoccus yeei]ATQ55698.1 flagellar motor protein MotB [Paracoccus yeei]
MANPERRRGRAVAAASLIALAAAGGLSYLAAREAADFIETRSAADVAQAMAGGGFDWARVSTDGLIVRLTGTAPDEVQRFRAKSRAEAVVQPGRVVDDIEVAARAALEPPDFGIELLRNDDGVSVLGLLPRAQDRAALVAGLRRATGGKPVSDLVETADYPVPPGWDDALAFGLRATQLAPRAKVSVAPGRVVVRAVTDSAGARADLEAALNRARPQGVALDLDVTAPRPVIAPFTLRFVKDMAGARFDACAADSETARDAILTAGTRAGIAGTPRCTLGLGAPSPDWAQAAVAGIQAVDALGAGAVTLSDADVALFAPASVPAAEFDRAAGRLQAALPEGFALTAEHEKAALPQGPAEFLATVNAGTVSLRGRVADARMREAVESLARARFGDVDSALRLDDDLPEGWTLRAIAALEAMGGLDRGRATVSPDLIRITGVAGSQTASDNAAARLAERLGAGARYELAIRYDRRLDPVLGLPSGVECVDGLNAAMRESEIGFEPSRSVIAGDPSPTLDRIAAIMADCAEYRIELGGHTDAQGSEELNAELSRARAQAVFEAMRAHGVDVSNMTVRGYGESRPVADNDTEAGREANRRIEFTLLADEPVVREPPAPARTVAGVTDAPEVVRARAEQAALAAATGALAPALRPDPAPALPPAIAAASEPALAAVQGAISLQVIDALTVPAIEAAFPDNGEAHGEGAAE